MKFAESTKHINNYSNSTLAAHENNDCSVRAFASLLDVNYDSSHKFVAERYDRVKKRGVLNMIEKTKDIAESGDSLSIDGVEFKFELLSEEHITNVYKVKGELISRKKTVKSFVQSHQDGCYLVFVSGHVFALKDGTIIDNKSDEYRPTRKVLAAAKVDVASNQLELF